MSLVKPFITLFEVGTQDGCPVICVSRGILTGSCDIREQASFLIRQLVSSGELIFLITSEEALDSSQNNLASAQKN